MKPLIKEINGITPKFGKDCYLSENTTIIGDVVCGDRCSFWFNSVIRGDVHFIKIGNEVNIQDGAIVHCTYKKSPTIIGNQVTVGHNAIVHGCTIKDRVLIGMGAIVLDDCIIESDSIVAAGAVLKMGTQVKSGEIFAGVPAKKVKEGNFKKQLLALAKKYVEYSKWYED
jgi:carbonic anhydrase/acetyltransferase-like protein (isoleucine patch superfamily)